MLTFGIGASSMALFARVGGGIFTPNFEGEIRRVAELPDVGR